ncbi:PRC-barrel domain containing protein (plasmid) [Halorarum halophilum]|uniref:PRC-barrel domain containing protein n=1 Tax=Halorarum halophilum TaxID=2743090 RepID=A0A7D5KNV4_9EURY|nr:PRC-barrel domain containing protein [Halobaculum halophilum]QLG29655.1 PRC-barrel domain containing protein [Halobaculum halophilum]
MVNNEIDTVTEDDVGKEVVYNDDTVGRIVEIRHGTAYVDPDPGIVETVAAKLGWADASDEEDAYPLQEETVERVTDDEVRLRTDL